MKTRGVKKGDSILYLVINLQAQQQRPACIGEVQACGIFGNDESEDESDN